MQKKEDNGEAIAKNLIEMATLEVPIICIVIGEGSSGGALALGVGDRVIMLENAIYSILSPEGFASILYKDSTKCKEAAENMKATATDLKNLGIIDKVIKEPEEGAESDFDKVVNDLKKYILKEIKTLQALTTKQLLDSRYKKFRNM